MKNLQKSMENIIFFPENIKISPLDRFVAAIGVFDGVHLGHREIIASACKRAGQTGAKVAAISFSPHPRALLCPDNPPDLLVSERDRIELLHQAGADICGFINFTHDAANLPPEEFLQQLKNNDLIQISGICVGSRWRFGAGGRGNKDVLEKFCNENNWSLDAVNELTYRKETISSTAIRSAIAAGNLTDAAAMLGRGVSLSGKVVHGYRIAGSKLNAPTANLQPDSGILPPDGVYSAAAIFDNMSFPAVINIGIAPTFGNNERRVEVHLIGFTGSLYDKKLTVVLYRFLRKEQTFPSPDELKKQIAKDIEAVKEDNGLNNN